MACGITLFRDQTHVPCFGGMESYHVPHLKGIMCYVDPTLIAEDEMSIPPLLQGGEVDLTDQGQLSWVEEWWRVS